MTDKKIPSERDKIRVVIVGAGIGGYILGGILHRAGISFIIVEKSPTSRQPGIGMTLKPAVMPVFEQLGIYEAFVAKSKPFASIELLTNTLGHVGTFSTNSPEFDLLERYGYYSRAITRPALFEILQTLVPAERVFYGKRVLSIKQHDQDDTNPQPFVSLYCADKTILHCNILVGADGAYSAVRQSLYSNLLQKNLLPKLDTYSLTHHNSCVVGVSSPIPIHLLHLHPALKDSFCRFKLVRGEDSDLTVWYIPLIDRYAWIIAERVMDSKKERKEKDNGFKFSHYGQESVQELCDRAKTVLNPFFGHTFERLLDITPKESMERIMLEEKFFETWFYGRTVLMGDAIHKPDPLGGNGGMATILDAISLGNLLSKLNTTTLADIEGALKAFKLERSALAKHTVEYSSRAADLILKHGVISDIKRYLVLHCIPSWALRKAADRLNQVYPQIDFLPQIERRGIFSFSSSSSSSRLGLSSSCSSSMGTTKISPSDNHYSHQPPSVAGSSSSVHSVISFPSSPSSSSLSIVSTISGTSRTAPSLPTTIQSRYKC